MDFTRQNPRCQQAAFLLDTSWDSPFACSSRFWQNFQFLVVVRLRSLFSCWVSAEGCFQLLKAAALFGSWPSFLSSKPNKDRLRPSHVACLAAERKGSPLLRPHVIKLNYQIIQDNSSHQGNNCTFAFPIQGNTTDSRD